ncbi:hypothetical protein KC343_g23017, partial [Hortaea werneckii]
MEQMNGGYQHQPIGGLQHHGSFSDSPPEQQQQQQGGQGNKDPAVHQRTYQACIPCRKRKVRCDLGSVDSPHDPPKKKNGETDNAGSGVGTGDEDGVYEIKNKKRVKVSHQQDGAYEEEVEFDRPRTPGGG